MATRYLLSARQVIGYLDAEDRGLEADGYEVLRDGLGVVVLGTEVGDNRSRSLVVLALFPE